MNAYKKILLIIFLSIEIFVLNNTTDNDLQLSEESIETSNYVPMQLQGYIKYESFFDTRQVIGADGDQFLAYPKKQVFDQNNKDINAKGQFNSTTIETRIRGIFHYPDIHSIQVSAIFEGDFFGRNDRANIFRLRHAFIHCKLNEFTILGGQTWHPLFVENCYPDTISFNGGDPIEPYSRNPQIRLMYDSDYIQFITAAITQLDFQSIGPLGLSSTYIRNAVIPNLHGQLHIKFKKHFVGTGLDFKQLIARTKTNNNFKVCESITSFIAMLFGRLHFDACALYSKITYAQNGADQDMLGGFAVHSIDEKTDKRTYTSRNSISWWSEFVIKKSEKIEPGIFVGVIKNLGARSSILPDVTDNDGNITDRRSFGIGTDIDTVFRVAPRIRWFQDKVTAAAEIEYTRACYGTPDSKGVVRNTTCIGNTRFLCTLFYYF